MVEMIDVRKILPDENQPRKYFAADKMYQLKQSIKKHGIKVPLTVEDMGAGGKFLLIDGERRFRASVELGLKEVPCVIEAPKSEADRLIEQFSIQEQHEAWTPVEKAMAILNLSKIISKSMVETCKVLDIETRTASRYIAFAELADKESFVKNEVPLDYSAHFKNLKHRVRDISQNVLEEEFTRSDEKKLEHQLTKLIAKGVINKRSDVVKIADSFKKNPQLIDKFMRNDNVTPTSLFLEAKAQGAYSLRNAYQYARLLGHHGKVFLKVQDVKITSEQVEMFKDAKKTLQDLINLAE